MPEWFKQIFKDEITKKKELEIQTLHQAPPQMTDRVAAKIQWK